MKFLVVTNAPTLSISGEYSAYAPYVREMDIWFDHVSEIAIVSPPQYPEKIISKAFKHQEIIIFKVPFFKVNNILNFFRFFILMPLILSQFIKAFLWADHIHLRCPGNMGTCVLVQIFFPKKPKTVKYAGNWDPESKQPWTYKLQKVGS